MRVWHANSYVAEKTKKVNAGYASYYLSTFDKNGKTFISRVAFVFGHDSRKLIHSFKTDPRIEVVEVEGNQVFFTIPSTNSFQSVVLDSGVYFLKPIIAEKGVENWIVSSTKKEDLNKLFRKINSLKPSAWAQLVSLKKGRIDLFAPNVLTRLSDKQRWAFNKAVESGYYSYPRKKNIQQLAKQLSVPQSTLRIHLRKAEAKLCPALLQSIEH